MGTQATSVNVKNPQASANHSKSTLIPLFQKLVVMPVTFGPGLPALIGRATCHSWPRVRASKVTSHILHTNYFRSNVTSLAASLWSPDGGGITTHAIKMFYTNI